MARLEGKVAIITGGGTGIGRATAELFCAEGGRVVICGRREQPLANTADLIRERGGQVRVVGADQSTPEACEEVVRAATDAFGPPTVLVNNAGVFDVKGRVHETSPEGWDRMMAINLRGPFLMTRAVIPAMRESGGGSIVNVGSILAHVAIPGASAYNASKAGLVMLTRSTAIDYAALDRALRRLAEIDPRSEQVVELRFFGGLTVEEAAEVLGVSPRTVKQDWRAAKAWLAHELSGGG